MENCRAEVSFSSYFTYRGGRNQDALWDTFPAMGGKRSTTRGVNSCDEYFCLVHNPKVLHPDRRRSWRIPQGISIIGSTECDAL